uniref:Uncharacterized protein n=1 Tax=Globodera rostochiensis TaxID=31243 RepID=A0A914HXY3_GLORO
MISRNLHLFYFFFSLLSKFAFLEIYGMDISQLNDLYIKLLFGDLTVADQSDLTCRLKLGIKQNLSLGKLCHLWQVEEFVNYFKGELEKATTTKQFENPEKTMRERAFHNCADLHQILQESEQNADFQPPEWVVKFRWHLSGMHFYALDAMIKADEDKMPVWFQNGRLDGETAFSYLLRLLNVQGVIAKISGAKQRIVHNLLSYDQLRLLELIHPIRLGAGFVDEATMREYYGMLFCQADDQIADFLGLWKMFFKVIGEVGIVEQNDKIVLKKRKDLLTPLNGILHLLNSANERKTIDEHKKSAVFRKCFGEQVQMRERFKGIFKRAAADGNEEIGQIVPDQFWNIFEEKQNETTLAEDRSQNDDVTFTITALNDVCPDKHISLEQLKEIDRNRRPNDPDSHILMEQYIKLLWEMNGDEPPKNMDKDLLRNVEMRAAIFYYRNRVAQLYKHGQFYFQNDHFVDKINTYGFLKLTDRQNDKKLEQKMCEIYQFIYKIVRDQELMEMSDGWKSLLTKNVEELATTTTNEHVIIGQIYLLPQHKKQWHQIDCANELSANEFVVEFQKNGHFFEIFHMFALIDLISTFDQIRSFFCHGTPLNITWLKHQIISLVSNNALERLEMLFPQVLHYDHLINTQLIHMLSNQFEFKSGTLEAENAEARGATPLLLVSIKKQEIKLPLCPLFVLYHFVEKFLHGNAFQNSKIFENLFTDECESSEKIKSALAENRMSFREHVFEFFNRNIEIFVKFVEILAKKAGTKTRFWKFLNSAEETKLLPDIKINWLTNALWTDQTTADVFNDETWLISHYSDFLTTTDSVEWLNLKLKLDLFIFVRWIDAKISFAIEENPIVAQRCFDFWIHNNFLFLQLYDRCSKKSCNLSSNH